MQSGHDASPLVTTQIKEEGHPPASMQLLSICLAWSNEFHPLFSLSLSLSLTLFLLLALFIFTGVKFLNESPNDYFYRLIY